MSKERPKHVLTVLEAVDNLSSLAELDQPPSGEEERIDWTDTSHIAENQEKVKQTFTVLNQYLRHIYEKNRAQLQEPETQRGIQAMMVLAGEAAQKLDKYSLLFKGAHGGSVTEIKEYQDFQKFYLNKIMRRFQESLETEAAWEAEWKMTSEVLDAERQGLKNLETVRRDKEYELFYIKKEDGSPYFNRSIVRHIRLIGEFDEGIAPEELGENPLVKFKSIVDRDLQVSAKEILKSANLPIFEFYKEGMRHKERPYVISLSKALMALMLAGNSRNLIQNTLGKSCTDYYRDFQIFLREALQSDEYRKTITDSHEKLVGFNRTLLTLSHLLCCSFFMRTGSPAESISYLHRLIEMTGMLPPKELFHEPLGFWNHLLEEDEHIRTLLKSYPSGPLLKALDVFMEKKLDEGFDPLSQGNYPVSLCTFSDDTDHVTLLRLPSPTSQKYINTAEDAKEFTGFLRYLRGKNQKHLLINLQDRTSWQEHARCACLERLATEPEFSETLIVATLPKYTDFYWQSSVYQEMNDAPSFIDAFKEQIHSEEDCGYYFPPDFRNQEFTRFVDVIMKKIHHFFFESKGQLSHKNRLDFIEIFYQFLILKLIDWSHPDTLSLSCKDGVDTGAAASATLFAFLRILTDPASFSPDEKDQLLWILFTPALALRDRMIDIQRFNRSISCLAHLHTEVDAHRQGIIPAFNEYYSRPLFSTLKIKTN